MTDNRTQAERIRDADSPDDVFYPPHKIETDEVFEGVLIGFTKAFDPTYRQGLYPIILVDDGNGPKSVHVFHRTLESALANANVAVGDTIIVRNWGLKMNAAKTQEYTNYSVAVVTPAGEPGQRFANFV